MGLLAPSLERDIKAVFKEKVFGTDGFLVGAETIAYFKWLIYTAMFKDFEQSDKVADRDLVHTLCCQRELMTLEDLGNVGGELPF